MLQNPFHKRPIGPYLITFALVLLTITTLLIRGILKRPIEMDSDRLYVLLSQQEAALLTAETPAEELRSLERIRDLSLSNEGLLEFEIEIIDSQVSLSNAISGQTNSKAGLIADIEVIRFNRQGRPQWTHSIRFEPLEMRNIFSALYEE